MVLVRPNSPEDYARLRQILTFDADRRRLECSRVIENLQALPTTQAVRNDLVMLGPGDVNVALRKHPGYSLERKIESVGTMLDLFRRALQDLAKAVESFPSLGGPDGRVARELLEDDVSVLVNKEFFAALAAAQTLVDYSRRVKKFVAAEAFESKMKASFSPHEHNFVIGLRNILIHQVHSEANWQKVYRFGGAPSTMHFVIDREDLLAVGELSPEASQHAATLGENIDITDLLSRYAEKIETFYGWLLPEIESNLPLAVVDYRVCKREVKVHQVRATYNFFFKSWISGGVDAYEHLSKHLTSEQLEAVSALRHRSTEQVDYIIACVDRDAVCDESLRQLAYELFKVPNVPAAARL
jgi:hypothetical protein